MIDLAAIKERAAKVANDPLNFTPVGESQEDVPALVAEIERLQVEKAALQDALEYKTGMLKIAMILKEKYRTENERLRAALEFYADEANYKNILVYKSTFPQYEPDEYAPPAIKKDKGAIARKVLEGDNDA